MRTRIQQADERKLAWFAALLIGVLLLPLVLLFGLLPTQWRLPLGLSLLAIIGSCAGYIIGRIRSSYLPWMQPGRSMASVGRAALTNSYMHAALLLVMISLLIVLLPGQFGKQGAGKTTNNTAQVISNPITEQLVYHDQVTLWDDRVWLSSLNTLKGANAALYRYRQPPKGYKWVLFEVNVMPKTFDAEFFAGQTVLKLEDDKGTIYLPDYGAGILNAANSYVRKDKASFWTPGYMIPIASKPKRIQLEISPGIDRIVVFRQQTRIEFCRAFDTARKASLKAGKKARPLPVDCVGILKRFGAEDAKNDPAQTSAKAPQQT